MRLGRTLKEIFLWCIGRRVLFRIAGHSMEPTLREGDVVAARRRRSAEAGSIVVISDSRGRTVVKRVACADERSMVIYGDNENCRRTIVVPRTASDTFAVITAIL